MYGSATLAMVWSSDCSSVAQIMHAVIIPRCCVRSSGVTAAVADIGPGVFSLTATLGDQGRRIKLRLPAVCLGPIGRDRNFDCAARRIGLGLLVAPLHPVRDRRRH